MGIHSSYPRLPSPVASFQVPKKVLFKIYSATPGPISSGVGPMRSTEPRLVCGCRYRQHQVTKQLLCTEDTVQIRQFCLNGPPFIFFKLAFYEAPGMAPSMAKVCQYQFSKTAFTCKMQANQATPVLSGDCVVTMAPAAGSKQGRT